MSSIFGLSIPSASPLEERQIHAYLKMNGEKNLNVRVLVSPTRTYLPQIEKDLTLLKQLLQTYERTKVKKG